MPSSSHTRCKVCRKITHARHRFGMCKQCSDKHQARLANQRRETQERRARRLQAALAIPVLEEGPAMPGTEIEQPAPDKSSRRQLTDAEQVEILDAYTKTDEPVRAMATRFGTRETYVYNVLNRVGISWRRGNAESFATWQANQQRNAEGEAEQAAIDRSVVSIANEKIPEDTAKALENMLKLPVLPPRPEPVAPTPAVARRSPPDYKPGKVFTAEVGGLINVEAEDMIEAIQLIQQRFPALRVTSIREA